MYAPPPAIHDVYARVCINHLSSQGDAATLYHSVTQKLFKLPGACVVYTGHDYNGFTRSSIAEEMTYNPRLGAGRTEAEFIKIMVRPPLRRAGGCDQVDGCGVCVVTAAASGRNA